ncbi:unnamed protein product [Rotaria socialis]|uniref:FAS-associated factor 1 n=1 Tax=Rotaria socialis TaxID=392032 RepID=A0A820GTW3_9BILA|nr:unnamed protein product [Rotaria socialis]CAF3329558.1 unnamed protein product [Rotaria socialis]CAF3675494.1 unnamed protein product [Rotaria socialis]CAF4284853.1 unnamed protein product [Rotaria socialis]CAF4510993.1 unnamed protein product [Rotaria socialis]
MSDQSREQILSDFQSCTGLEHIDECIHVLEQYEWILPAAVQSVLDRIGCANDNETTVPNQDTVNNSTSSVAINTTNQNVNNKRQSDSNDIDDLDQPRIIKTIPGSQRTTTGIIGPVVRDLNFTIECRDRTEQITMFDNESVYQLKAKICEKIPIPPNKQNFLNWETKSFDDHTILRDLHLPKENKIQLSSIENGSASRTQTHTSSEEFPITVLCEDQSGNMIPFKLTLQSNTTINDLKKKIEHSAHIPLQNQSWQGLLGAKDSDELSQTSITSQIPLILHRSDRQLPSIRKEIKYSVTTNDDERMDIDHDSSLETYEDDNHALSQNETSPQFDATTIASRVPLIPDECTDDVSALENFARVFHARYGSTGPILYIGPLDQAIQDSVYASIHNRRPLAIYLHNDQSVCANVFCSQVLATDSIVEYLANNYVFWAWDVTSASNRTRLFETVRRCVGNQCVHRVGSIENDTFPLILIVVRSRGSLELVNIIEGKSTPSEVLLNLIQSHESFEEQRLRDVDEEIMREKRENLKKQQEDEYEQSLQADLAKERARQEEYDASERLKQQRLQQQEESKARLPEEPSETEKNIIRLKIRLPNDEGVLMRRFHINDNLQVLFDYLTTHERMLGEYKLLTTYPKRDLASLNASDTFEQLKLYPQEQLILESL